MATISLEGLGRRFLPIPGPVLYFAKDVVLLAGLLTIGLQPSVIRLTRRLAGPLPLLVSATAVWGVLTLLHPDHPSVLLGLVGMRQYLLWWIAPLVCAAAMLQEGQSWRAERILAFMAIGIAALAAYQFTQPPDALVNAYVWGEDRSLVATVTTTGRVRVTSTFSYISGFADFVILVVPILLAAAVSAARRHSSRLFYAASGCLAASAPLSGGRAVVMFVAASLLAVLGFSGALRTRRGRLTLVAIVLAAGAGVWVVPEAAQGIQDRFDSEDTPQRIRDLAFAVPVYTLLNTKFPFLGAGVGTLQAAGVAFNVESKWEVEAEPQRVLIELGLPGYILVWLSRFVMTIGLVRLGRLLSRAGSPAWAAAAWVYAGMALLLPLTTDHVVQALFFVGVGWMLARVVQAQTPNPVAKPRS